MARLVRSSVSRMVGAVLLSVGAVTVMPALAFAHPKGTLTVTPNQASPGDTLVIRGTKLGSGALFRIELQGALRTVSFGRVHSDSAGAFELRVPLPADVAAGDYEVAAVASDGDVSAQADVTVGAPGRGAPGSPGSMPHMADMPGMEGMPGMANMPMASAERMKVEVPTTGGEWTAIAIVVAFSALIGLYLLRPANAVGSDPSTLRQE